MKASLWVAPVATVVILFGSGGTASLAGAWVTGGREQIASAQRLAVDDIKGWMTIQQAADGLGVSVDDIITLIDPEAAGNLTPATAFKEIEAVVPGFSLATFRDELRAHLAGAPASAEPPR